MDLVAGCYHAYDLLHMHPILEEPYSGETSSERLWVGVLVVVSRSIP